MIYFTFNYFNISAWLNSSIEIALATEYPMKWLTFSTLGLSVGQLGLQR